jgi:7,8-dihydro-6-hydroxymethylpterin-pyrophosphokinase
MITKVLVVKRFRSVDVKKGNIQGVLTKHAVWILAQPKSEVTEASLAYNSAARSVRTRNLFANSCCKLEGTNRADHLYLALFTSL